MAFYFPANLYFDEVGAIVDEDGVPVKDASVNEQFDHAALGSENTRILGLRGKGTGAKDENTALWRFHIGNLQDPASLKASHPIHHLKSLVQSDPSVAADYKAAGISKSERASSHSEPKTPAGHYGDHRVELRHPDGKPEKGEKRAVKVKDVLQNISTKPEQLLPLSRVLDKWANHIEKNGGEAHHVKTFRWEAAAARHSADWHGIAGAKKQGDEHILGDLSHRGGRSANSGDLGFLDTLGAPGAGAAPAAVAASKPAKPDKGVKGKAALAAVLNPDAAFKTESTPVDPAAPALIESVDLDKQIKSAGAAALGLVERTSGKAPAYPRSPVASGAPVGIISC